MMKIKKTAIIIGLILIAIYFFAGITRFGAFDYDEAVYCAVVAEMLGSGSFLAPKYNGEFFLEKPPLFYWLTVFIQKIFRFSDIALSGRIVSILATLGTIFLLYYFTSLIFDWQTGLFAAGVFIFSLGTIVISRAILMDSLLNFFLSLALFTVITGLIKKSKSISLIYISTALATLTKGPVGIVLPGLITLIFFLFYRHKFSLKELKLSGGIALYLLITVSVFLAVNYATRGQFFPDFFITHNLARFSRRPFEGHQGPWFYYLLLIFFLLFPGSAFLPAAVRHLGSKKSPEKTFFFIWFLVILIIFSLSRTKLPNYIIPAITPLSVILGIYLKDLGAKNVPLSWPKITAIIYTAVALLLAGIFFLLTLLINIFRPQLLTNSPFLLPGINLGPAPIISGIIFLSGIVFFILFQTKKLFHHLFISQIILVFLLDLTLINFFVPEVYRIFQADLRQISEYINHQTISSTGPKGIIVVDSGLSASLVLYTKGKVFFVSKDELTKIAAIKKQFGQLFLIIPKNLSSNLITENTRIVKTTGGYVLLLWST